MAIKISTLQEVNKKMRTNIEQSINSEQTDDTKKINTLKNNFTRAIIDSISGGIDDNNKAIQRGVDTLLPFSDNASDDTVIAWAAYAGITRNQATQAVGIVTFTGSVGAVIPLGTSLTRPDGVLYTTTAEVTITNISITSSSVVRVGQEVTVTTQSSHNLTSNVVVTITGADQSEYNVTNQTITVTGEDTFTFSISGSPVSPATGTILCSFTAGSASVNANEFDANSNIDINTTLSLVSPIVNVDNSVLTAFGGVDGGTDIESIVSLSDRGSERWQNLTINPSSVIGMPIAIKENVTGVTRVLIKSASPTVGKITIIFVRDGDLNIIPNTSQVNDVKNYIINNIKDVQIPDENIIVQAPTPVSTNFVFSSLSPNTVDMQNAIISNLEDFFKNDTDFETSISSAQYNNIIYSTTDSLGNAPTYTLSSPLVEIVINEGEIATLGTITF